MTSAAFKRQVRQTKIDAALSSLIEELDGTPGVNEELNEVKECPNCCACDQRFNPPSLQAISRKAKSLFLETPLLADIEENIVEAYASIGTDAIVAVRSSATAEGMSPTFKKGNLYLPYAYFYRFGERILCWPT